METQTAGQRCVLDMSELYSRTLLSSDLAIDCDVQLAVFTLKSVLLQTASKS